MEISKNDAPTKVEWKPRERRQLDSDEELLGPLPQNSEDPNGAPPVSPVFQTIRENLAPVFGPGTGTARMRLRRNLDFSEICWILCEMLDHANENSEEIASHFENQLRLIRKACKVTRRLEVDRYCFGLRSGHREVDRALECLTNIREDVERYQSFLAQNGNGSSQLFVSNDLFRLYEVIQRPYAIEKCRYDDVGGNEGQDAGEEGGSGQSKKDWESIKKTRGPEAAAFISRILKASGLPESLHLEGRAILHRIDSIVNG